ncbi:MAG: Single-stranded-DNA-specific exonuclease RecJ [Parcubacteria group bacterium]|nr:Single-stranded-DNA-specific exonuclease RecJ [Parcubacteria group bacterium]
MRNMFPLHDLLDDETRSALAEHDDLMAGLLARRGVTTKAAADVFLDPSYEEHIHDPMQIKNMPKAARRVADAINAGEKIAVWSDYDCDGIPGGVILHDFLKKAGANFVNYIPHRHNEGYGVNEMGLEKLASEGVKLVITVDSGITDVEAVAKANELGMEVIVTDHHLPGPVLPPAFAVIDPKQDGETYPFRELCGAALAWKLSCAVLAHGFTGRELIPVGWEKWLLDMAGLATIADMVPLTGENRVIAKYGLFVMRKSPRLGFGRLCKAARVEQRSIAEDDVAFMIAPRVNAASRMGDPRDAFTLFTTTDEVEADLLAKKLEAANRSRRAAAGAITKAVHERIAEKKLQGELPAVIAMGDPDWRPGLLGLVASGIADEYDRPVFLWGREGSNVLKGSCRGGPGNVHVVELMTAGGDIFAEFGGHAAAGGFSLHAETVHLLEERLCEALASLPAFTHDPFANADAHIHTHEATPTLLGKLERLAPFGMGNPKPTFVFRDVTIHEVSWFGKSNEHLRLRLKPSPEDFSERNIEGIAFYAKRELGSDIMKLEAGNVTSILASLERDMFTRSRPVRLRLIDIA